MDSTKSSKIKKCRLEALPSALRSHWEYVVNDFLETGCLLTEERRELLLRELRVEDLIIDSVEVHPAFAISRRLVVVVDGTTIQECWLYYPRMKKIEKYVLKKTA